MSVVPPTETDLAVLASEEALVSDSDPMGIAPEVGEDLLRTAEGGFGVDHPVLGPELGEERPEGRSIGERGSLPGEVELACLEGLSERFEVLPPEDDRERPHREEEASASKRSTARRDRVPRP